MMAVSPVTVLTSGILGIIYVVLSFQVSLERNKTKVLIGDGSGKPGAESLLFAIRAQANFGEYVPFALILLGGIEFAGVSHFACEVFAVLLVLSRIMHAIGVRQRSANKFRAVGAVLTWLVILGMSLEAIRVVL